ncbi:MAG: translation initiation factor eIF-2B [Candidatus Heimdallarchaeota archaeon]
MNFHKLILKELSDLKNDNTSGANEFIDKTIRLLESQLKLISNPNQDIKDLMLKLSREIINSRPSMAPLINTIGYIISDLHSYTKYEINKRIENFHQLRSKIELNLEKVFQNFITTRSTLKAKIMLISYSSTIIKLLKKNQNRNLIIYILESRPLLEGQLVAEILSSSFETHLIIDAAMGKFIEEIDFVLVGIDSVLKDGSIVNKIGTYPLACIANENKKQVFGVGDSFKYNLKSHFNNRISIETKPSEEVYDKKIKNELLQIHNYYFDITPPQFISGIISDLGLLTPQEFLKEIKDVLPLDWYKEFI